MNTSDTSRAPGAALVLGVLGILPFVVFALASHLTEGFIQAQAWFALTAYGAVILSFLGGVHWGMAIARNYPATIMTPRLIISVVPSLFGWAALMMPTVIGLLTMALAYGAMLWTDFHATRLGHAPAWYPRLRLPLTAGVVLCLLVGAIA